MKNEEWERLRRTLANVYSRRETAGPAQIGLPGIMNRVRRAGSLSSREAYMEIFERFLWRFAPVACLLILVLTVALTKVDFVSDYELSKVFLEDPANFSLPTLFKSF